jgi:outer membrane protein assembly factor BamB
VWTQNAVNGLQADTGQILWRQEIKSSGDTTVATPVAREDLIFAGGLMLKLGPGKTDHKVLWPDSASGPRRTVSNTSTPLIQGGAVYSHTTAGKLVCLDLETGRQLWETNSLTTPGNGSSLHFTVTPDCVLVFTDQGNLLRATLEKSGYREMNRAHVVEPLYSFGGRKVAWVPPAFAEHSAILRNDTEVIRIDLSDH